MASVGVMDVSGWTRTSSAPREGSGLSRIGAPERAAFSLSPDSAASSSPGTESRGDLGTAAPSAARSNSNAAAIAPKPATEPMASEKPIAERTRPDERRHAMLGHPMPTADRAAVEVSTSEEDSPPSAVSEEASEAGEQGSTEEGVTQDTAEAATDATLAPTTPPAPAPPSAAAPSGSAATAGESSSDVEAEGEGLDRTGSALGAVPQDETGTDPGGQTVTSQAGAQSFASALAATGLESTPNPTLLDGQDLVAQSQQAGAGQARDVPGSGTGAPAAQTAPPVPLGAVPMTIGLRALGATSRFEIRLDPIELGRIEVSLDIDRTRNAVSASLVVERPETLALLKRDASSLQQALSQAGLDASQGIALSLRGGDQGGRNERGAAPRQPGGASSAVEGIDSSPVIELPQLRALRAVGGLDIRI